MGMLDFDKDGNPLNDLMGMAGKMAGGGGMAAAATRAAPGGSGGMLGKLLGMFRKR